LSAYIVDHDHIDALLSYGIAHNVRYVANDACIEITKDNATEIGRILLDENERSVRHRYPGSDADDLPGTIGQDAAKYKFRRWPVRPQLMAMTIIKACDGFEYQAGETDDYEQSLAATIIRAIRKWATSRLPGYSDAPGWSMHRPVKAVKA
jgi:hypothetical protein